MHLDMKKEAAAELWSLKDMMPRRRSALIGLSKIFFELGDYYHSLIIVLRTYERQLEAPGVSDDLWFLAYPQGYWRASSPMRESIIKTPTLSQPLSKRRAIPHRGAFARRRAGADAGDAGYRRVDCPDEQDLRV